MILCSFFNHQSWNSHMINQYSISNLTQLWKELPPECTLLNPNTLHHSLVLGIQMKNLPLMWSVKWPIYISPRLVIWQGRIPGQGLNLVLNLKISWQKNKALKIWKFLYYLPTRFWQNLPKISSSALTIELPTHHILLTCSLGSQKERQFHQHARLHSRWARGSWLLSVWNNTCTRCSPSQHI